MKKILLVLVVVIFSLNSFAILNTYKVCVSNELSKLENCVTVAMSDELNLIPYKPKGSLVISNGFFYQVLTRE